MNSGRRNMVAMSSANISAADERAREEHGVLEESDVDRGHFARELADDEGRDHDDRHGEGRR